MSAALRPGARAPRAPLLIALAAAAADAYEVVLADGKTVDPAQTAAATAFADRAIAAALVDAGHRDALTLAALVRALDRRRDYRGLRYTDADVIALGALCDALRTKPAGHLEPVGDRFVASTAMSLHVQLMVARAKAKFSSDAPEHWKRELDAGSTRVWTLEKP